MECDGNKCECVKVIEDLENQLALLQSQVEKLREALRPFAEIAKNVITRKDDPDGFDWMAVNSDYLKAKEAYDSTGVEGE